MTDEPRVPEQPKTIEPVEPLPATPPEVPKTPTVAPEPSEKVIDTQQSDADRVAGAQQAGQESSSHG